MAEELGDEGLSARALALVANAQGGESDRAEASLPWHEMVLCFGAATFVAKP